MPSSKSTPELIRINYTRGDVLPTLADIFCTIVEPSADLLQYNFSFPNTAVSWLKLQGLESTSFIDLSNPNVTPVLQNLNLLSGDNYFADILFQVSSNGNITSAPFKTTFFLTITGTSPNQIKTEKTNYDLVYNRATNALSGDTSVNILNNTGAELLNFTNNETIFENVSGLATNFAIAEASGNPLSANTLLPLTGTKVIYAMLKKADGTFLNNFTITLSIINDSDLIVTPNLFAFEVQKSLNESKSAILKIVNPLGLNFTVTYPSWLTFPINSGNTSADLNFSTESSGTLAVGELNGSIVVSYDTKTVTVPVSLSIINFVTIDGFGTYNFCLDDIYLRVFQINETAKTVRLKIHSSFETAEKTLENNVTLQLVYVNKTCKMNLGQKIHNYFPRNRNCILSEDTIGNYDNKLVYKPAKVTITLEELDDNLVVLKTETLSEIKLYPGNKPKLFPLFTNSSLRHRVKGSTYIFSYLADLVNPIDITDANLPANTFALGDVQRVKIEDSEDKITFPLSKTILGCQIITLPETFNPVIIEWQNQNLAKEWFVFTGEYKFNNDYAQIQQKSSFTTLNEKFDVTKERSIIINTGFILKEEADVVDEIIQSKLVFLKIEGKIYRTSSSTTKLVAKDSTLELVQFDVEFFIAEEINGN